MVGVPRPFAGGRGFGEVSCSAESSGGSRCHLPVRQGKQAKPQLRLTTSDRDLRLFNASSVFPQAEKEPVQKEKSLGFLDLLRTRNIRGVSIILWLIW